MARKYRKKSNAFTTRKVTKRTRRAPKRKPKAQVEKENLSLSPEIKRGILSVMFFVLALLSLMSLFEAAGNFGTMWVDSVSILFGKMVYAAPVMLVALGVAVLNLKSVPSKSGTYIGFGLFVIGFVGIAHLFVEQDNALEIAREGEGGGLVGYAVSFPLFSFFGFAASLVVFIAVLIISMLLFFNQTPRNILDRFRIKDQEEEDGSVPAVKVNGETDTSDKVKQKLKIIDFKAKKPKKASAETDKVGVKETDDKKESAEDFGPIETKADTNWEVPPLSLLDDALDRPSSGDIKSNARIIQETLGNFDIPVEMGDVSVGPTVTQYTLRPDAGIKLNKIVALQNDLALALAAHPIRIEAPVPGRSVVGIEIPNVSVATVRLRELLASKEFGKQKGTLLLPLGRDVAGSPVIVDIEKMPHLLIAGATGTGKSVAINTLLSSLLYKLSPSDLKLILVDPKRVEMGAYNDIPHLLTPVITDAKKTVNSLKWIVNEMDRRYKLLQAHGARNITSFNASNKDKHLPRIVLVIDELSDLMSVAPREVEASIVRLAQMARAVGIHLIVATQRPSVDVITGLIKANITTRIAFSVSSLIDSRTIIDSSGAEKLLGNGDMLFMASNLAKPRRIQGGFVSEKEVEKITNFLKAKEQPDYLEEVTDKQGSVPGVPSSDDDVDDDLYDEAKELVIESGKASASYLQRRLRVGYARAARLIDLLEEKGVVGPGEGAKPREILVGREAGDAAADEGQEMQQGDMEEDGKEPDLQDVLEDQQRRDGRDF
ncbi:DNA translocase FtsK 4TM domain-containing protein [Patescibacteria group bacterium]